MKNLKFITIMTLMTLSLRASYFTTEECQAALNSAEKIRRIDKVLRTSNLNAIVERNGRTTYQIKALKQNEILNNLITTQTLKFDTMREELAQISCSSQLAEKTQEFLSFGEYYLKFIECNRIKFILLLEKEEAELQDKNSTRSEDIIKLTKLQNSISDLKKSALDYENALQVISDLKVSTLKELTEI